MTAQNLRTVPPVGRLLAALLAAALATVASGSGESVESFVAVNDAAAESSEMRVGDRLVALVDVELDQAIVKAGSSVSVVARKARAGNIVFDVALADGHVVKSVPQVRLRNAFRVG